MSLRRFIAQRILVSIPVMFGVSVITFALVYITPSDPVSLIISANPDLDQADAVRLRRELGFDQPLYVQYWEWLTNILRGDLGEGFNMRDPDTLIKSRWRHTVALGLFAWAFALIIAIPTGVYAAIKKDQFGDDASRFVALFGISIPNFWLGLILIGLFAVEFDLFSVLPPQEASLMSGQMLWWLLLPGVTLGTAASANIMRIMRTSMVEEMNKEYVTAARAKGLPERNVILKHVLRNSLISVVTVAAFLTASIVAGAVVVEFVFSWPGLGQTLVNAIVLQEVNIIMALTLFTGLAIIIANLLADILYAVLDPRIRDEY